MLPFQSWLRVSCKAEVVVRPRSSSTPEKGQREHRLKPAECNETLSPEQNKIHCEVTKQGHSRESELQTHMTSFPLIAVPQHRDTPSLHHRHHDSQEVGNHSVSSSLPAPSASCFLDCSSLIQCIDLTVGGSFGSLPLSCLNLK